MTDESFNLCQRALYVEIPKCPVDDDKVPVNGYEYISQVRAERAKMLKNEDIDFSKVIPVFKVQTMSPTEDVVGQMKRLTLSQWKCQEAIIFGKLVSKLNRKRGTLKKKFPPQEQFPVVKNETEVCLFCIGSELCKNVFPEVNVDHGDTRHPLLSIVLHLTQKELFYVLLYFNKWSLEIGWNHILSRWAYALLACFKKPISDRCSLLLETMYDTCYHEVKVCDQSVKYQLHLLLGILRDHFCVKYNKLGPDLDQFVSLC